MRAAWSLRICYHFSMTEQTMAGKTPEDLLQLKDNLTSLWEQLPPEHQATMLFALMRPIMESDMARWIVSSLALLYPSDTEIVTTEPSPFAISPIVLGETEFSAEEIAQLSEADLLVISEAMQAHYTNDL